MIESDTFCPACVHSYPINKKTGRIASRACSRRTCPAYAPKYLRDQAERLKAALAEWDGETTIMTLTAPGADRLPWDESLCKIDEPHRHSGPAGCAVNPWAAAEWNTTVCKRLGALLNHSRVRTRRAGSPLGSRCERRRSSLTATTMAARSSARHPGARCGRRS